MTDDSYAKSAAYHEAGHVVVAAVQGLRLLKSGIHVDPTDGTGISYYESRTPDSSYGIDSFGERTIISLFAGLLAQRKFHPTCTGASASADEDHASRLLTNMYIPQKFPGTSAFEASMIELADARAKFREIANSLVEKHWSAIDALAQYLWELPPTPKDSSEHEGCWSGSPLEKRIDGLSILSFLTQYGIPASFTDAVPHRSNAR